MADILYFASLAEMLGTRAEQIDLPSGCNTVDDLVAVLRARGEPFASTFDGNIRILVAINQEMCEPSAEIAGNDEIAFFPPVTGG
ncbi:MAG: molybdopterin converting factor subunit 1 [Gammaproteobacteria bacterium]|nr:molybdopterin converting factor subunit 1 [Gammaproteobacteria bacterium]